MLRTASVLLLLIPAMVSMSVAGSAAERLDAVLSAMKAAGDRLETLQARFDQTDHDHILEMDERSAGMLYVEVPGRVRWEYDVPVSKVLLVKEDTIQLYIPTAHQVQEFKRGQMRGAGADLLVGFGKSNAQIAQNYDARLVGENDETVELSLVPRPGTTASVFQAIDLTVEKKRWIPIRSVFHEANRDTTTIAFEDLVINGSLPSGVFELDLPPGVEIIRNK